jgi:Putative Ig domain
MRRHAVLQLGMALLTIAFLSGCGGSSSTSFTVVLTPNVTQSIDVGQSVALTAFVAYDTTDKGVNWTVTGTNCTGNACGTFTELAGKTTSYIAPSNLIVSSSSMTVTVTATAIVDDRAAATINVYIYPKPQITTTSLPNGINGENYSQQIQVSGGSPPLLYSIKTGSLPGGLQLNTNGIIYGRPSVSGGKFDFTLQVSDQGTPPIVLTQPYSITIQGPPALNWVTTTLPDAAQGSPYNAPLNVSGGVPPITWSIISGGLPPGMSLDPTSGQISGTPSTQGAYTFMPQVVDSAIPPQTASPSQALTLTVGPPNPLSVATSLLPDGLTGTPYSSALLASGGVGPFTWTITSGILPSGLTLTSSTGVISGLPTAISTNNFTVQVTDSENPPEVASAPLSLSIVSSSNNSLLLDGNYVFLFNGYNSKGPVLMGGLFTADGGGTITVGAADINSNLGPNPLTSLTGRYTIGNDGRGNFNWTITCSTTTPACQCLPTSSSCTTTTVSTTFAYQMVIDANGDAQFEEADISGFRGTGIIRKQTLNTFTESNVTGNYAFEFTGADASNGRVALAGVMNANGSGVLSNGNADVNDAGAVSSNLTGVRGTYLVSPDGRATASLSLPLSPPEALNYIFYMASPSDILVAGIDTLGASSPMTSGELILQTQQSFDATSLNSPAVVTLSGVGAGGKASVLAGLLAGNGANGVSVGFDANDGGTITTAGSASGTYTPATNGRFVLAGLGNQLSVLYLVSPNQGFVVGKDSAASAGIAEAQETGISYNESNFASYFTFGSPLTGPPGMAETGVSDLEGTYLVDGAGNLSGKFDKISATGAESLNQVFKATYIVATNGRGTFSVTSPASFPPQMVFYMVSPTEVRIISVSSSDSHPQVYFSNH